jgi:nitronate monooxygenase
MNPDLNELLGIQHPILLAAMDLVADARLTLAVSEAGGFGILGGGYGDTEWLRRELPPLAQAKASRKLRFGVGFITWSLSKQPQLLDQALAAKPDAIWLSFGDPAPFVEKIKAAGALVICQVQTVPMAQDAGAKGADIIVAQGAEGGGHGIACSTLTLVPTVVDAVGHKVPVVAAGGIGDGRGLAAVLMLGAQGAALGTRFYASQEAAGHPDAKARIVKAVGETTVRSTIFDILRQNVWPGPYTGRCLENDYTRKWAGRELELMRRVDEEADRYLAAKEQGDFDVAAVIAGEVVGLIRDLPPAADIVRRIVAEADELIERAMSASAGSQFRVADDATALIHA